ncbi:MAG: nucleotidyltransferase domain-containing protein [Leptolyngbyaceae cyanobacterium CAN_BIN12]|nr:nucleotidyltransferase domain-containing protein [Leptolyngbyaceae cyanobacterium CAN_BIN12]
MKSLPIPLSETAIAAFCQQWQIVELALFGSVLRADFRPDSDVDVLVTFAANAAWNLLDLVMMQQELEALVGREIDLIEKQTIERSPNWIRREGILNSAQVFYSANI